MMGGEFVTAYHGTAQCNLEPILRDGLKPQARPGGDKWALMIERTLGEPAPRGMLKRSPSVYVTTSKTFARNFSICAAMVNKDHPALVELRIPKAEFDSRFVEDEYAEDDPPDCFRTEAPIPPEWIVHTTPCSPRLSA